jgi:mannose-1-phosphate guanylyltransferase
MKIVILAAGAGTRLWPLSTPEHPKQFLRLHGQASLLQNTFKLYSRHTPEPDLYVLSTRDLLHLVKEQLPKVRAPQILAVPERKEVLANVLFALNQLKGADTEPVLFAAVDYVTDEPDGFHSSLQAFILAHSQPTENITLLCGRQKTKDMGYVRVGAANQVTQYIDKPAAHIDKLLASGKGYSFPLLFVASRAAMRAVLEYHDDPTTAGKAAALLDANNDQLSKCFLAMPAERKFIMHRNRAPNVRAHPAALNLIDVGSFEALYAISPKDNSRNVVLGNASLDRHATHNLVINQIAQPLEVGAIKNSVIVQTPEGLLVRPLID